MKDAFLLTTKLLNKRRQLQAIESVICYNLAENNEDLEIATLILEADKKLSEAITKIQKEVK